MVRIRNLLIWSCIFVSFNLQGQRIRKNHLEMTPSEKSTYRNAVIARRDVLIERANHHSTHFNSEIHTRGNPINGTQFLPWHRLFIVDLEQSLRSSGVSNADKITIPYWDWTIENNVSNITWDDFGFLDLPTLNNNSFNITRGSMTGSGLATTSNLNSMLALNSNLPTSFELASNSSSFFSKRLEHWHNAGHNFIGGTMGGFTSPQDPVFYLHHNFVDKLWQDWEDKEDAVKSFFGEGIQPFAGHYPFVPINSIVDSRKIPYFTQDIEVWFASNQKLLLDGLNGAFITNSVNNSKKTYCYVAWNGSSVGGTIYAGDVARDANDNIVADSKGGFIVSGAGADFSAGSAIELLPGFSVTSGAVFSAQIVDRPCGYSSNFLMGGGQEESNTFLKSNNSNSTATSLGQAKAYPNPFADFLNVSYPVVEDTPLSIELINGLGQVVWQRQFGTQFKGEFQTVIPSNDLPKGLYTVLIHAGTEQKALKVVH